MFKHDYLNYLLCWACTSWWTRKNWIGRI